MKRNQITTIVITLVVIIAAAFIIYQNQPDNENIKKGSTTSDDDTNTPLGNKTFKDAINAFAFDIFKEINKENNDNMFISPYSIFTALAMTYEGAKEQTADEMQEVLKIQQNNASFHEYVKNLYEILNKENNNYNISTANALWVKQNYQLLEQYLNIIRTFYEGEATEVDFSNPEEAASIINQWVEDNTNGLIKDLILPSYIDPYTALILTNAIYFKGIWKVQFDPANTTNRTFEKTNEENIQVPTMKLVETEDIFNYTETNKLQVLELPYTGSDLSMVLLLPKDNNIQDAINALDDDTFSDILDSMYETSVDIYLPKFKVETEYQLKDYLKALGMNIPFTTSADFSGMNGVKELFIDKVVHKAYIELNEEGTEAAAATAVIMALTAMPDEEPETRIVFDCDHPFIYLIQHKQTGTILFMGIINNPIE